MRSHLALSLFSALVVALLSPYARGQCLYEVAVFSGPDCNGTPPTRPAEMTEGGEVVGYYSQCVHGPDRAFTWTSRAGVATLPVPVGYSAAAASAISGDMIVGRAQPSGTTRDHAVMWVDGVPMVLEMLPGGDDGDAWGVNASGVVVGRWGDIVASPGYPHAFRWEGGIMIDLKLPLGPKAAALNINDQGKIVGWMGESMLTDSHAFVWEQGQVTDLGVIPGGFTGRALSISPNGQFIVGAGQVPAKGSPFGATRAAIWTESGASVLQPFERQLYSAALDVNDFGQVVGRSWAEEGNINATRGFLFQNGVMWDLNDLLAPGTKTTISQAVGVNNAGKILARVDSTLSGLLTPIGVPDGDVDCDCRVGTADLLHLLADWGPCGSCRSDLNGDGYVNADDLAMVILNWG